MASHQNRQITHLESGRVLVERARWCDTYLTRMRGFTFRRALAPGEGLVLVEKSEGRVNTGVTMLFTFMTLGVIWVDSAGKVVDTALAKPWRLSYMPQAPAQYAVEVDPSVLEHVKVGDHLRFSNFGGPHNSNSAAE